MATDSHLDKKNASREATEWFILMQDEPDDAALRARFDAWRSASSLNSEAWDVMQRTAGLISRLPPTNTGNWQNTSRYNSLRWRRKPVFRAVVSLAAAACVAWFIAPDVLLRLRADAQTSTAETRDMALADGSHIRLAPKSAIALDYAGGRRHVTLLAGEAFFTVTHDASHPFVVTAGKVTTTDIGTSFDIRRSGEGVLVAVREGRVRVTGDPVRPGGEELAGGEALDIHQDTTHRALVAPDHIGAWGQGLLVADEEPMRDVVDHLRPWLTARVMVLSPQATRHITGTYTLNAPDEALEAIARAQQATLYHISPWLIVIR